MTQIKDVLNKLFNYCKSEEFRGYDPYDGLNSKLFQLTPLLNSFKITRQAWTQLNKKSPVNFRKIFLIQKGYNPKGLALFILGLINLFKSSKDDEYLHQANKLLSLLKESSIPGYAGNCWGYNFPWQSRSFYAQINTPNAICSVFVVEAFLEAYDITKKGELLDTALKSANFFTESLNINKGCFSYTPNDNSQVHNINLLTAYIIARINNYQHNTETTELAKNAVKFSLEKQNGEGYWYYGEGQNQRWIDNFHTAYNLIALKKYKSITNDSKVLPAIKKGYDYYDTNFLFKRFNPKYFNNKMYPIDIHSVSIALITYLSFSELDTGAQEKAEQILEWVLKNMYDEKGYFYFQKNKYYLNKISYMRWSQAWMFYALSIQL